MTSEKSTIRGHFDDNVRRIEHLLETYETICPDGSGAEKAPARDLLRSAVVFLHAALEDVVRTLAKWRLPKEAGKDALKDIGLPGNLTSNQFHLGHVGYHRGKTVDELISQAVSEYLDESNFNEPGEIQEMLERCGIDSSFVIGFKSDLHPMMRRRHWIVHRMDRDYDAGSGRHATRAISEKTVATWKKRVCALVDEILARV